MIQIGRSLYNANPCHNPKGPGGGQFCSTDGGGVALSEIRDRIGGDSFDSKKIIKFAQTSSAAEALFVLENIDSFTSTQSEELLKMLAHTAPSKELRSMSGDLFLSHPRVVGTSNAVEFQRFLAPVLYGDNVAAAKVGFAKVWQGSALHSGIAPVILSALNQSGVRGESGLSDPSAALLDKFRVSDTLKSALKEIYGETQSYYQEKGIKSVSLQRGVYGGLSSAQVNKIESWTSSDKVALKFAGKRGSVVSKEIPVKEIFYSFESHPKLLSRLAREKEYVVFHNQPNWEPELQVQIGKSLYNAQCRVPTSANRQITV